MVLNRKQQNGVEYGSGSHLKEIFSVLRQITAIFYCSYWDCMEKERNVMVAWK